MPDNTIPATPTPQLAEMIASVLRILLLALGAAGITVAGFTNDTIIPLAGALSTIIGASWAIYEQFRQARMRHAAAVASARGGKAVMHRAYTGGQS